MQDPVGRLSAALSGRYEIERELGQGGMATVYLADDLRHGRKVALKVLKPELAAVVGAERFLAEIRTTASLQHPHILPLHDSGEADALLFYVMPYVEGESLQERLDREHQLPVEEAVRTRESSDRELNPTPSVGTAVRLHASAAPKSLYVRTHGGRRPAQLKSWVRAERQVRCREAPARSLARRSEAALRPEISPTTSVL